MTHEPIHRIQARRVHNDLLVEVEDEVAGETPVELVYNGIPYAVMMATPADLHDFAVGFSVSEGIVGSIDDIEIVEEISTEMGISIQMMIPKDRWMILRERRRNIPARSGCGVCGVSELETAIRPIRPVKQGATASVSEILHAFGRMSEQQVLNGKTGAVHAAAALFEGHPMLVREDVGRHNAVDKAFGAALRLRIWPTALLVTSRASYEIVHKAAQLQCAAVAAISAPTALAVKLAREANITLLCYTRPPHASIYAMRVT